MVFARRRHVVNSKKVKPSACSVLSQPAQIIRVCASRPAAKCTLSFHTHVRMQKSPDTKTCTRGLCPLYRSPRLHMHELQLTRSCSSARQNGWCAYRLLAGVYPSDREILMIEHACEFEKSSIIFSTVGTLHTCVVPTAYSSLGWPPQLQ